MSVAFSEIIEKIYAVVNGEIITYSELKNAEIELTGVLRQQYSDDQLTEKIEEMKKNLLNRLIDQKIILSVAKEKNYNVDAEVEFIIKDIKKKNNINSDEELKKAIRAQGIDYDEWIKQLKETSMQHMLIREEIGSKIKIDNAEIMEYYKNNIKDFTKPREFSLNCIYLEKEKNQNLAALSEKMQTIDSELRESNFEEVAKKHSQLQGSKNNYFLGEFKQGELDANIEEAALKLKKGEHSSWIETDNGWYIIQLLNRKEPELIEYKTVRGDIENELSAKEQDAKLQEYIEELKKESHIKIYEEFK
jgi:parvulin-like peptidyl-prolyl isomerase